MSEHRGFANEKGKEYWNEEVPAAAIVWECVQDLLIWLTLYQYTQSPRRNVEDFTDFYIYMQFYKSGPWSNSHKLEDTAIAIHTQSGQALGLGVGIRCGG